MVICFLSDFYFDNVLFGKLSLADAVISEKSLDINFPIFEIKLACSNLFLHATCTRMRASQYNNLLNNENDLMIYDLFNYFLTK